MHSKPTPKTDDFDHSRNKKSTRMDVKDIQRELEKKRKEYNEIREELRIANKKIGKREKSRKQTTCNKLLEELVHDMAAIACSNDIIENVLGLYKGQVSDDAQLREARIQGWALGKNNLLSWQFETASRGSHAMQIWLGKNYLSQDDKVVTEADQNVWETLLGEINATQGPKKEKPKQGREPKPHALPGTAKGVMKRDRKKTPLDKASPEQPPSERVA